MRHYWYACNHVAQLLNDKKVLLEAYRVPAAKKAEDEISHFLRGILLLMKNFVVEYIAHARASGNERSLMFVVFSYRDERPT